MKLKSILQQFHSDLDALYDVNEVNAFFNLLIEYYLGIQRIELVLHPDKILSSKETKQFTEALKALKAYKPIQYIIGETEFFGLDFLVNEHTLIPRPETEELVSFVLETVDAKFANKTVNILDIGTGSGCISVALAKHLPTANLFGLDVSSEALKVAKQNAEQNSVTVEFIQADILDAESWSCFSSTSRFDVIISNPPYVRQSEKEHMNPNVLNYEPSEALFVDNQKPLVFYKAICEFANLHLKEHGFLFFEINEYLGNHMQELLKDFGFKAVELRRDIFGKDRMIKGSYKIE